MPAETFTCERFDGPRGERVRLASARHVFIRFRGRWEFYIVRQGGNSHGLEMFVGYVEQPAQVETLERAAARGLHTFAEEVAR